MSDVYQVGGIEAKLTLDTQEFSRSIQDSQGKLTGLYTQINTLPPAVQKLEQQEKKLTQQMEEQRQKLAQMYANLDSAADQYLSLEKAMGRVGNIDLSKQFSKESAAIDQAEAKLQEYNSKLKQVEQQKQQAIEKMNAGGAAAASKQEFRDNSLAIDAVANSLRGLSPLLGDTIGNVGTLAERLVFMKRSMDTAASSSAVMGAAVSGGITLAISAIGLLVSAMQDAEAKRQQILEDAIADQERYTEELRKATEAVNTLDSQTSSISQLTDARQQLADLFPQLILGYDEEGEAILRNSEAMDKQLEMIREQIRLNRELMILAGRDTYTDYQNLLEPGFWDKTWNNFKGLWAALMGGEEEYTHEMELQELQRQQDAFAALQKAIEMCNAELQNGVDNYDYLDRKSRAVADQMIDIESERIAKITDENERISEQQKLIEEINAVLGNSEEVEKRYNVIISTESGNDISAARREDVNQIHKARMEEIRETIQEEYDDIFDDIRDEIDNQYDDRKAAIDREYQAVSDGLKAQVNAYKSLKFDIKSLDEQDLANKMDLLNRRLEAEQDANTKSILMVQERYYKEAQLIIDTANQEIQVYQDKLDALDEADRQAEEARKARQNANKLRDLNESYQKQQAENEREMAEATEKYEKQRDELQAIIDNPPSKTAQILAQRDLAELNKQWAAEREGLELEHAEKLLKIQRQLDEEKLTQQEEAEADRRDQERESLNDQISDLENNTQQQLEELANRYTAESDAQQKALSEQEAAEQKSYQRRLDALQDWKEDTLEKQLEAAEDERDQLLTQEALTQKAWLDIRGKTYDQLIQQYGDFLKEEEDLGKKWAADGPIYSNPPKYAQGMGDFLKQGSSSLRGYASGGIIDRPTVLMAGEGGEPEAILPMSKLYALVNGVLAGSQDFLQRAHGALQSVSPTNGRSSVTTVNIQRMEVRSDSDIHLIAAELAGYAGGGSRW